MMLSLIVFLPLIGTALCAALPKKYETAAKFIALFVAGLDLLLVIGLTFSFDFSGSAQFVEQYVWMPQLGISYSLAVDGISLPLLVLSVLLVFIAIIISWRLESKPRFFFAMLLLLEVGMNGVFLASDLILFYLFWELVLIPMYFLITQWGGPRRSYAALKFFLYTFLGSVFMLIGIVVLYLNVGSFDMAVVVQEAPKLSFELQTGLFFLFFLGFAVKVPIWPLHTWLPDAHVEASTAISAILAGVLLKMGLYGFIRVSMPMLPDAFVAWSWVLAVLALVSIIYGAIAAFAQSDIKKLVAYSSVSHMGFAMLALSTVSVIGVDAALAVGFSHGLISALLFLLIGMIYDRAHTRERSKISGLWKAEPVIGGLLVFAAVASMGIPGLSGFVGEFLTLLAAWSSSLPWWMAILALCGVLLSAVYMLALLKDVAFGQVSDSLKHIPSIFPREILAVIALVVLIVAMGVYWNLLLNVVDPSAQLLLQMMEV